MGRGAAAGAQPEAEASEGTYRFKASDKGIKYRAYTEDGDLRELEKARTWPTPLRLAGLAALGALAAFS